MTSRESIVERTHERSQRGEATYVQPDEYCRLLLSWRKMERIDDKYGEVCGLLDLQSGRRYFIERQRLMKD